MLTLRLPEGLEERLSLFSKATGESKNKLVARALEVFLSNSGMPPLGGAAISDNPPVTDFDLAQLRTDRWEERQARAPDRYAGELLATDWIDRQLIWGRTTDGTQRLGFLGGRSKVVGFTTNLDEDNLHVIAQYLPAAPARGTDRHHFYIYSQADWKEAMKVVSAP